jgi:hypothetical protein
MDFSCSACIRTCTIQIAYPRLRSLDSVRMGGLPRHAFARMIPAPPLELCAPHHPPSLSGSLGRKEAVPHFIVVHPGYQPTPDVRGARMKGMSCLITKVLYFFSVLDYGISTLAGYRSPPVPVPTLGPPPFGRGVTHFT